MMFSKSHALACFMEPRNRYNRGDDCQELYDLFNKKFKFRFESEWALPGTECWFSAPPWKTKELEVLKSRLNFHKSQLNDFDIEEWSGHTRRRNPAGEVCWKVRCVINPEFLTQAWTKFYECACSYPIIPAQAMRDRKMVSLHLCEAPGAFITSLNHFLKLNHPDIEWQWLANTLNPYYEGNSPSNMISDDRFMFHTLGCWDFGADHTGNLMDWDNSQAIVAKAKSLGKVMLVTADGSIDCLQRPDAQEEVTSPLHYCEIVTALQALSSGGTLIFKLFTMFEHSTVSLLYLINQLFEQVHIYKPVTSRQGNSEVYAVCLNFRGENDMEQYLPVLKTAYGTELYENSSLFPLGQIPQSFLKQIEECGYYFSSIQCQVINNNLQAYLMQNNIATHRDIKNIRAIVAAEYIWQYNLKPLDLKYEILKGILHEENKINTNPRYHRGSYTERQLYTKMSLKEKSKHLSSFLQADVLSNTMMLADEQAKWISGDNSSIELAITYGLPLTKVNSSKFIFVPIFKLYQQILAEEDFRDIIIAKKHCFVKIDVDQLGIDKEVYLPEYDHIEPYHVHEKRCFKVLLESLKELDVGSSMILGNFDTLTHFNVSVLYILSKLFDKIGFTSNGRILLNKMMNRECLSHFEVIQRECEAVVGDRTKDVLNTLPVQVTNAGEFFSCIVFYNNTFYRNKCTQYLAVIEQNV